MMLGLGTTPEAQTNPIVGPTAAVSAVVGHPDPPTVNLGLSVWRDPTAALQTLPLLFQPKAFGAEMLPFTIGVLAVPVAVVLLLMNMGKK